MKAAPDISLPRFEGPLDLLLDLVRKQQIDIADIPIAEITRQFLDYFHAAERLDIDLGADFTYIAALLIHIKSRSLLARDPAFAAQEEDPRQELVRLLMDHDEVRGGAEFLQQKLELAQATWSKSTMDEFRDVTAARPGCSTPGMNLLEVLRIAREALEAAKAYELIFPAASVTVEEMERWLEDRMRQEAGCWSADRFLAEQPTLDRKAALFLAVLERAKAGRIRLEQAEPFGAITLLCPPQMDTTVP